MSLLDNKDVMDFEYESKSQVFYNIPPLDDKKDKHRVLDDILAKMGFARQKRQDLGQESGKLFGIFKNKSWQYKFVKDIILVVRKRYIYDRYSVINGFWKIL